ncbi:MAG: hypothetical protein CL678_04840 [Bdellovibrionaceae bacterium]|nr:hypothetical protein [Pseudobdellovibrionaceae bacterium]|tara:strand:- start:1878 stop:3368 length:1491 start_codon:yes stop_codon:yes gene_type:complete
MKNLFLISIVGIIYTLTSNATSNLDHLFSSQCALVFGIHGIKPPKIDEVPDISEIAVNNTYQFDYQSPVTSLDTDSPYSYKGYSNSHYENKNRKLPSKSSKPQELSIEEIFKLDRKDQSKSFLSDLMRFKWLDSFSNMNPYTLLFGTTDYPTTVDLNSLKKTLSNFSQIFFYDADSISAKDIQKTLGKLGVGITADPNKENLNENIIAIENPYLRLKAFSIGKSVGDTRSVTALALHLIDKLDFLINYKNEWDSDFLNFKALGKFKSSYLKIKNDLSFITPGPNRYKSIIPFNEEKFSHQFDYSFKLIISNYLAGIEDIDYISESLKDHKKAVFFGSSSFDYRWRQLVQLVAKVSAKNKYILSSGGGGGLMEAAANASIDNGGTAIDIIIGKSYSFSNKRFVIESMDYETRIPFLLHDKDLIFVGPGGNGTMKELATTFVDFSGNPNKRSQLAFINSEFYKPLLKNLISDHYPEWLKRRIHLIDSEEDAIALMRGK